MNNFFSAGFEMVESWLGVVAWIVVDTSWLGMDGHGRSWAGRGRAWAGVGGCGWVWLVVIVNPHTNCQNLASTAEPTSC